MTVKHFTFSPFQTNCYVCHDDGHAVLVDPSCQTARERQAVLAYLDDHELDVRHLLLTHAHIDHIFGCSFFADHFDDTFQMHRADLPLIERAEQQATMFGVPLVAPPEPERFLSEGDVIRFGSVTWHVLHTPGHSPGSICFYDEANHFALSGDVLFQGSIGRTDLPGGSMPELMRSIFEKLVPLGDETNLYPGHGPPTTIGQERANNPFLTGAVPGTERWSGGQS